MPRVPAQPSVQLNVRIDPALLAAFDDAVAEETDLRRRLSPTAKCTRTELLETAMRDHLARREIAKREQAAA